MKATRRIIITQSLQRHSSLGGKKTIALHCTLRQRRLCARAVEVAIGVAEITILTMKASMCLSREWTLLKSNQVASLALLN
jgi:hypothetical protein